jgi:rhodanese-related sulfurtransferase
MSAWVLVWIWMPATRLTTYSVGMYDYEVTVQDAKILLEEGSAKLIDVREPWEYSTAHIENSLLMPMGDVPSRAHQELDPDDRLLILCHHGARSLSVTNWLRQQGFDAAQSIAGGIDAWSCEADTSIPRY